MCRPASTRRSLFTTRSVTSETGLRSSSLAPNSRDISGMAASPLKEAYRTPPFCTYRCPFPRNPCGRGRAPLPCWSRGRQQHYGILLTVFLFSGKSGAQPGPASHDKRRQPRLGKRPGCPHSRRRAAATNAVVSGGVGDRLRTFEAQARKSRPRTWTIPAERRSGGWTCGCQSRQIEPRSNLREFLETICTRTVISIGIDQAKLRLVRRAKYGTARYCCGSASVKHQSRNPWLPRQADEYRLMRS